MSTWGGIGEGLAAGMNRRIDIELQERERKRQQANADRQFAFQREQADRAQANADRAFSANREDAARAQSNADRSFAANREDAARAQANVDRQFEAGRDDEAFKRELSAADLDIKSADLDIRRESADWQNRINAERVDAFKLQNQKLLDEWNRHKEKQELVRMTGRNQLAHGIYAMQSMGDGFDETTIQIDGKDAQARVMPQAMRDQIFGSEGPLSDIANMFIIDTDEGKKIGFQRNGPNGMTTVLYGDDDQYDVLRDGVDKDFADGAMSRYMDRRNVGLKIEEAEGKAMATAKATLASDPYGRKRSTDAAVAILKSDDATDEQRRSALATLEENLRRSNSVGMSGREAAEAEARRRGFVFNEKTGRWEKKAK